MYLPSITQEKQKFSKSPFNDTALLIPKKEICGSGLAFKYYEPTIPFILYNIHPSNYLK